MQESDQDDDIYEVSNVQDDDDLTDVEAYNQQQFTKETDESSPIDSPIYQQKKIEITRESFPDNSNRVKNRKRKSKRKSRREQTHFPIKVSNKSTFNSSASTVSDDESPNNKKEPQSPGSNSDNIDISDIEEDIEEFRPSTKSSRLTSRNQSIDEETSQRRRASTQRNESNYLQQVKRKRSTHKAPTDVLFNEHPFEKAAKDKSTKQKLSKIIKIQNLKRFIISICKWGAPFSVFPLFPCVILEILLLIPAAVLYGSNRPEDGSVFGGPIAHWLFYIAASFGLLFACDYILSFVLFALNFFFFGTKIYYYFNTVLISVALTIWCIVNLIVWEVEDIYYWIFTPNLYDSCQEWFSKLFISGLVLSSTRVVVKLFTKYLILHIHRNHFWERIAQILYKERMVDRLAFKSKKKLRIPVETASGDNLKKKNKRFVPVIHPDFGQFTKVWNYALKSWKPKRYSFSATTFSKRRGAESLPQEVSAEQSIQVAQKILKRMDRDQKGYLVLEDFLPFCHYSHEVAVQDYRQIDPTNSLNKLKISSLVNLVDSLNRERAMLYDSLFDRETMAATLNRIITVVWLVVIGFVILIILGVDFERWLLPLATGSLGLSFIFGNSAKIIWEGVLELYVVRPFDIGDRIFLPTYPTLVVNSISLLSTTAFSTDGRMYVIPNSVLFNTTICQYKRSKNYTVYFKLGVSANTNAKKIELFQQKLVIWFEEQKAEGISPWNIDGWMFWIDDVNQSTLMTMAVWIPLEGIKWSEPGKYLKHQTYLWLQIQKIFSELHIAYVEAPKPVLLHKDKKE